MKKGKGLPKTLTEFEKRFPEIWRAYQELKLACDRQGPLDAKTRELIKVGIETACARHGGLAAHIRRAQKAGAKGPEILQAILLAAPLAGFPAALDGFLMARKYLKV